MNACFEIPLSDTAPKLAYVSDIVTARADRTPRQVALVEQDGCWTFGELAASVAEVRQWLVFQGVRPGDRVMIVAENCRALVALLFAAIELRAWPVLVSARLSDREIDEIRDHSCARRVVFTVAASPRAATHARRYGATFEESSAIGRVAVSSLNERADPEGVLADPAQQVAALIYTSGTTGRPKGVMLTHRNLLFIAGVTSHLRGLSEGDHVYGVIPITHILGLAVVLLGTLLRGATLHLASRFDPASVLRALANDGISWIMGGPALFSLLVEYAKLNHIQSPTCRALRILSSAGAPLDPAVKAATEHLFGTTLHNGYGITECSPTITQTRLQQPRSDVSVGPILPGIDVKLVGPQGDVVSHGDIGELRVRGPSVMKGYYKDDAATAAAIDADGWFNTRDLARFEGDHLFIVGRAKELIIRYGFNVNPPEIEAVLNAHPAVLRSAVVGRPVEGDEEIVAYVQPLAGTAPTTTELAAYAAQKLAVYKQPSEIVVMPALPIGPSGKVLKSELAGLALTRKPVGSPNLSG